jgi:hypothetical protein
VKGPSRAHPVYREIDQALRSVDLAWTGRGGITIAVVTVTGVFRTWQITIGYGARASSSTHLSTALSAHHTVHSFPCRLAPSPNAHLLTTQGSTAQRTPSHAIAPHPLVGSPWLARLSPLPSHVLLAPP